MLIILSWANNFVCSKFNSIIINMEKFLKFEFSPLSTLPGFTLAEVLITLGIIGIVAAITIPILMNSTQNKELVSAYKKAYSVANQAYTEAVTDNGTGFGAYNFSTATTQSFTKFNAIKSKLNVIKECPYNSGAWGKCWSPAGVGYPGAVAGCSALSTTGQNISESFTTSDGMFWMLYPATATTAYDAIYIDVNGSTPPNDWGKDVFILKMNDTNITPFSGCGNLKHNDGTSVVSGTEFLTPLLN